MLVREGDRVKAGDLLVRLDLGETALAVDRDKSGVASAEARVRDLAAGSRRDGDRRPPRPRFAIGAPRSSWRRRSWSGSSFCSRARSARERDLDRAKTDLERAQAALERRARAR